MRTLTYGEFDLDFFLKLLDLYDPGPGSSFVDLGSGSGRCALAAALHKPQWQECTGVELLPELTKFATAVHSDLLASAAAYGAVSSSSSANSGSSTGKGGSSRTSSRRSMAPVTFITSDFCAAALQLSSYDLCFAYSTMFPADSRLGLYMEQLSRALAHKLKPGATVITVDKCLCAADGFELLHVHEGANEETEESTAYVYRFSKRHSEQRLV